MKRSTAWSGTTLFALPPSILAGLIASPSRSSALSPSASAAAATIALRPSCGLRPAWAARPVTVTWASRIPLRDETISPFARAHSYGEIQTELHNDLDLGAAGGFATGTVTEPA